MSLVKAVELEIQNRAYFGRLNFPFRSLSDYHVVQFVNEKGEQTVAGLGIDLLERRAYLKAAAEYFERKAYFENKMAFRDLKSTNGVAAHVLKWIAKHKARSELIERDALFRHWFSKTPFLSAQRITGDLKEIARDLMESGLALEIGTTYLGVAPTDVGPKNKTT